MTTNEGNILIATYDGWTYRENKNRKKKWWTKPGIGWDGEEAPTFEHHWELLIPVVEKISNHRWPEYYGTRGKTEEDGEYDDCVYLVTFGMRDKEGNYMVRFNVSQLFKAKTLKEATWLAVTDFVEQFNQNK